MVALKPLIFTILAPETSIRVKISLADMCWYGPDGCKPLKK